MSRETQSTPETCSTGAGPEEEVGASGAPPPPPPGAGRTPLAEPAEPSFRRGGAREPMPPILAGSGQPPPPDPPSGRVPKAAPPAPIFLRGGGSGPPPSPPPTRRGRSSSPDVEMVDAGQPPPPLPPFFRSNFNRITGMDQRTGPRVTLVRPPRQPDDGPPIPMFTGRGPPPPPAGFGLPAPGFVPTPMIQDVPAERLPVMVCMDDSPPPSPRRARLGHRPIKIETTLTTANEYAANMAKARQAASRRDRGGGQPKAIGSDGSDGCIVEPGQHEHDTG